MTMLSCAVLDDYQGAALASADWSRLADRVEVRTVERPLAGVADLAATVGDCEILVIMRERTPFPAEAFEALPRPRLLVHLKLSDRIRGLIGAAELKRMRPTAYLINTSRAQIVDQEALAGALESGWIAGAGADVFEVEPLPAGDRFRRLPNLLATPHLGYVTRRNHEVFYGDAVEDIEAFMAGAPVRVVNG